MKKQTARKRDHLVRGIPDELWQRLRHRCIDEAISLREGVLRALQLYVGQKGEKDV